MPQSTTEPWTTRRLLAWMADTFATRGLDSPKLSAEILLTHVTGTERLSLYTDPDRPASDTERDQLRALVKRALNHEPIQYLVGRWSFFGVELKTDRRALIPRPATETICEHILQTLRRLDRTKDELRIADICTGSGCIALALAKNLPNAHITATDLSPEALELATENATDRPLADRIEFREGNLLEPISNDPPFDAIVSNPPYIPDHEWDAVEPNVKDHEPHTALRAGPDGLDLIRPLLAEIHDHLAPGGLLAIELAASHATEALELARTNTALADPSILKDHEGLDRVLIATRA